MHFLCSNNCLADINKKKSCFRRPGLIHTSHFGFLVIKVAQRGFCPSASVFSLSASFCYCSYFLRRRCMFLGNEVSLNKTPRMVCPVCLTNVSNNDMIDITDILRTAVRWSEQEIPGRLAVLREETVYHF